jgi:hypothetical protein
VRNFSLDKLKGRDSLEELSRLGMIILKWVVKGWDRRMWTGFVWLRIEELHNWSYQVKEDEMGGACSTNGAKRSACRILL